MTLVRNASGDGSSTMLRITPPMLKRNSCGKICANGHSNSSRIAKVACGSNQRRRRRRSPPWSISRAENGSMTIAPSSAPSVLVARSTLDDTRVGRYVWMASIAPESSSPAPSAISTARQPVMRGCSASTVSMPSGM